MNELLEKIQKKEIEALCLIAEYCEKNNISFYLRGGSALGAIKYGGFVPWDDDIDIALPRLDYNKLIFNIPEWLSEDIRFVSYQNTNNAHCYFPRVILDYDFCKKNGFPINNERGLVLIDILPLDGMPNTYIGLNIHIIKAYIYRILASLWTLEVKTTVSMHGSKKQRFLRILHKLGIHHLYKQDDIYRKLDCMYSKYPFGKMKNAGMLASSKLKKEITPYVWWGKGCKVQFCGLKVLVPEQYDLYLKQLFGNNYAYYEPDENERKKSHVLGVK